MKDKLLDKLLKNDKKNVPFHMPGHKRVPINSALPYNIDITEIEGFDNLHDMSGILAELSFKLSRFYNSFASFPLIGGSTCGVLAGIYVLAQENKNVLIARNCHKSVYNAAEILNLNTHYIMPDECEHGIYGKINPERLEEEIVKNNISLVVLTSPTYDGITSDIEKIYSLCRKHKAYLFIDAAHGAHMPEICAHCDACVMSLHKTLPALTQTAVLNICSLHIDLSRVSHALSIFETSSPSYVLLASIDECMTYLADNPDAFSSFIKRMERFYKDASSLKNISVTHFDDLGKIIISSGDGYDLAQLLRAENIEVELVSRNYVLAMATVCDTDKSLNALLSALVKIDRKNTAKPTTNALLPITEKITDIHTALCTVGEFIDVSKALGTVSLEYIWAYPPGVPLLVPGEIISEEIIDYIVSNKELKSTKGKLPKIYTKRLK